MTYPFTAYCGRHARVQPVVRVYEVQAAIDGRDAVVVSAKVACGHRLSFCTTPARLSAWQAANTIREGTPA